MMKMVVQRSTSPLLKYNSERMATVKDSQGRLSAIGILP